MKTATERARELCGCCSCRDEDDCPHASETCTRDIIARALEEFRAEALEEVFNGVCSLDFISNDEVTRGTSGEKSMQTRVIGYIQSLRLRQNSRPAPQEKCEKCLGTGRIMHDYGDAGYVEPCPKCQPPRKEGGREK